MGNERSIGLRRVELAAKKAMLAASDSGRIWLPLARENAFRRRVAELETNEIQLDLFSEKSEAHWRRR